MTARYMLDTDICIYIAREQPPQILARFEELEPGEAVISVITWGELRYGSERSKHRQRVAESLDELSDLVPVEPLPKSARQDYGAIRAALEAQGTPIGNNDLWIAAHARAAGLTLVTNNEREFQRVPGLEIENWAGPSEEAGDGQGADAEAEP
jgi:tRNA(fMet)-specific endonuclease VapC